MKKVVVVGGGTGTYSVLKGLKKLPLELSAIVSMTDSGGSNRVLRDEFGLLPTSDIRQCIVALASEESNGLIRELFTYRFNQGTGITGMTFGNLFMAALSDIYGSQKIALEKTCELLQVKGKIIPVTYEKTNLVARYQNGKQVLGEHEIDEPDAETGKMKIVELDVFPQVRQNPEANSAIKSADLMIFGPGDLYTSIICNIVVGNVAKTIIKSKAKKVYVVNLMTKFGQTNGFSAMKHLQTLESYLKKDIFDYVLINKTSSFSQKILGRYAQENSEPVIDDFGDGQKIIRKNFMSEQIYKKTKGDKLSRSLIRHDSAKLAHELYKLL